MRESAWQKEKAILKQKIQILNEEVLESKSREDNLRQMNDTIMKAMSQTDSNKSYLVVKIFLIVLKFISDPNSRGTWISNYLIQAKSPNPQTKAQFRGKLLKRKGFKSEIEISKKRKSSRKTQITDFRRKNRVLKGLRGGKSTEKWEFEVKEGFCLE